MVYVEVSGEDGSNVVVHEVGGEVGEFVGVVDGGVRWSLDVGEKDGADGSVDCTESDFGGGRFV